MSHTGTLDEGAGGAESVVFAMFPSSRSKLFPSAKYLRMKEPFGGLRVGHGAPYFLPVFHSNLPFWYHGIRFGSIGRKERMRRMKRWVWGVGAWGRATTANERNSVGRRQQQQQQRWRSDERERAGSYAPPAPQ